MIVKDGWDNFLAEIRSTDKPIVCFGAGTISIFVENLFIRYGIWGQIAFFLDNDPQKEGKFVGKSESVPIITVDSFRKKNIDDFILLITIESYVAIEKQFSQYDEWNNVSSYAYIKLNKEVQERVAQPYNLLHECGKESIPKVIHYCWFGKGEKTELHKNCINSWKKYCPNYQIIEWNEENYDVAKNEYMRQAYEFGKWAYVSDYARIDILYNYGGIFLDTDVELVRSLDELVGLGAFIAHGQWPAVNSGAGIGAVKGNLLLKEMMDGERNSIPFIQEDGSFNMTQNGYYESNVLYNHGWNEPFLMQRVEGMLVLAPEIMATASVLGPETFVTDKTISIHHCMGSWASKKMLDERKETLEKQQ